MKNVIYMTYKNKIPNFVTDRWLKLNPKYKIDFSLDEECIHFINTEYGYYLSNMFKSIKEGMYKADLWRLCRLYKDSGVYADVDLVPHIDIDEQLSDPEITFYSCLSIDRGSLFQAFIVNKCTHNPLLLCFLVSFVLNRPYRRKNGPCYDMYACLCYNLNVHRILPKTKYKVDRVKIPVHVGISSAPRKVIHLGYWPTNVEYKIHFKGNSVFRRKCRARVFHNELIVESQDGISGWNHPVQLDIVIASKQCIYLFQEHIGKGNNWRTSYVMHKSRKILDSRDPSYNSTW